METLAPATFYLEEVEKLAASLPRYRFLRERMGRRPMRVATLLRKEKDGTLFKTAKPRLVRAWREAQQAGNTQLADQYAKAYGDLGLKGRYLNDVSGGGSEAGVDRMMGRAPSGAGHESGYLIRKMYKPDSQLHQGEFTKKTLEQKQLITDAARAHSPAAKEMVPDMYGFKQHGTDANPRFTSYHEPVSIGGELKGHQAISAGLEARNTVINPMAEKGHHIGDVATTQRGYMRTPGGTVPVNTDQVGAVYDQFKSTGGQINPGNLVRDTQGKTKILDFLPGQEGSSPTIFQSEEKYRSGMQAGSQYRTKGDLAALRKEVHAPTPEMSPQHLSQQTAMFHPPAGSLRPASPPKSPAPASLGIGRLGPATAATAAAVPKAPAVGNLAATAKAVPKPISLATTVPVTKAVGKVPSFGSLSSPFKSLMR